MRSKQAWSNLAPGRVLLAGGIFLALLMEGAPPASAQSAAADSAENAWTVTIVLPPHLVAEQAATLAVLSADGKLARGVEVDLGNGLRVRTDPAGRAYFTVPADQEYLLAKSQGSSAVALVDSSASATGIVVPPRVSIADGFSVCGGGFRGDAESNHVTLGGQPALVLASSPECIVVLAPAQSMPGATVVSVKTPDHERTGTTALVSLQYESALPPLAAQKKSRLRVVAEGTRQPVLIRVHNETPGVLQFAHGDDQIARTSGGEINVADFEVDAIRSGNYSFRAQVVPPARLADAVRYLDVAIPLAGRNFGRRVGKLSAKLQHHPRDSGKVAAELDAMRNAVISSNLRTLLDAARDCL